MYICLLYIRDLMIEEMHSATETRQQFATKFMTFILVNPRHLKTYLRIESRLHLDST